MATADPYEIVASIGAGGMGEVYPQWGAGGRELFYVSPDRKLMAVSLKLGVDSVEPSRPRELFALPATDICAPRRDRRRSRWR